MSKRCCMWMESCKERKRSSETPTWSPAARVRVGTGVICMSSNHLSTSSTLEVAFKLLALSQTWTVFYLSREDGSTVADIEQEEKKGALCRRSNYFSRSIEIIRTPLPGSATVSLPLPRPEQSLIKRIVLEHSLDDIKRVVCRKLGLADDLDVQLTQIRGNSSIVLEDGNDIHHLLRWP